jgi:E3 SUMO-protein ligase PIAS1
LLTGKVIALASSCLSYTFLWARYFDDILKNTPKTVESVTIDAEARWSAAAEASNSPMPDDSDDDDNDIVEIPDGRPAPFETLSSMTPVSSAARDSSVPAGRSSSSKRPVSQVIDLTLSDDDDDEPARPAKRVNAFPTPSSMNSDVHSGSMQDLTSLNNMQQLSNHSPLGTPDPFYSSRR